LRETCGGDAFCEPAIILSFSLDWRPTIADPAIYSTKDFPKGVTTLFGQAARGIWYNRRMYNILVGVTCFVFLALIAAGISVLVLWIFRRAR
jgi:hypothetical protein